MKNLITYTFLIGSLSAFMVKPQEIIGIEDVFQTNGIPAVQDCNAITSCNLCVLSRC